MQNINIDIDVGNVTLMGKDGEHVKRFRVQASQKKLVVLARISNFKTLLLVLKKTCSVASIVENPFATPTEIKTKTGFSSAGLIK